MEKRLTRRVAAGAVAAGASLAMLGGSATAVAADVGNDARTHTDAPVSVQNYQASNQLGFSMWELCDLDAFPYGGPTGTLGPFGSCTEVVVRDGQMNIGGLQVPIPEGSLRISGQEVPELVPPGNFPGEITFEPAPGTNFGVEHRDLPVPGGAFGSADGLNFTSVNASVEAVGVPQVDALQLSIDLPMRVKLENPLLGDNCYLGSERDPIMLQLRGDDGGDFRAVEELYPGVPGVVLEGAVSEDQDFSVPGAQGCGLWGSLNWMVNSRANTPSPAGNNSIVVQYNAFNASNVEVRNWITSRG